MTLDEWIFEAITYRRYVGADAKVFQTDIGLHTFEEAHLPQDDLEALQRLEAAGKIVCKGELWLLAPQAFKIARGPTQAPVYRSEDPWILLALCFGDQSRGDSLATLISTADYINHAIPTYTELYGALNRLYAAGLITKKANLFFVTEPAAGLYRKAQKVAKQALLAQLSALERFMDCPCCGVPLKAVRWRIDLPEEEYTAAVSTYHK